MQGLIPCRLLAFDILKVYRLSISDNQSHHTTTYLLPSTVSTMVYRLSSICLILANFLSIALAHNIQMGAHSRECFHEQLHKDDKMTVTFQVGDREFGGAGNLEVDFWVGLISFLRSDDPPNAHP